jgi:hypothetical protein
MQLDHIAASAARCGLALRGAFHPGPDDAPPTLADGARAGTLALLGFVGGGMWPHFAASTEARDGLGDGLDRWSRRVIDDLAAEFNAAALYPFGREPAWPFQRWAMKGEAVHPSPIGILIHPDWGLWHGYRGALALQQRLALPPADARPSPCDTCAAKPCLSSCPVAAFGAGHYDVAACIRHIATLAGRDCIDDACRARRACPVGAGHRYGSEQARFHMSAFLAAYR